eukprot:3530926-Prymnesium_polylepis.1
MRARRLRRCGGLSQKPSSAPSTPCKTAPSPPPPQGEASSREMAAADGEPPPSAGRALSSSPAPPCAAHPWIECS